MKVTVNEAPVDVPPAPDMTVASLLDELRESGAIPADQVVVGLELDTADGHGGDDILEQTVSKASRVAVATDDMRGYARRILTDLDGMLAVVRESAPRIAEKLRSGSTKEANSDLYNLFDALQQLLFCLCQIQNTCLPEREESPLSEDAVERLNSCLDAVQECQQRGDWEAVADRLDDTVEPALAGLGADARRLKERVL